MSMKKSMQNNPSNCVDFMSQMFVIVVFIIVIYGCNADT